MNELVIATQNPGKIAELRALLAEVPVRVLGLDDAGGPFPEPPETGQTFEENAALKARAYAELTGLACLADDSGLEVDALSGQPGVDSAWYAYDSEAAAKADAREIRDPRNNAKLLARLEGVPLEDRTARFVCCMAMAVPCGSEVHNIATTRGTFEGRIGIPPRIPSGTHGFGYDPLFLVEPEYETTSAELTPEKKNAMSHRGKAARIMAEKVAALVAQA
jgi:XTP/dITP diphosphohydrolase